MRYKIFTVLLCIVLSLSLLNNTLFAQQKSGMETSTTIEKLLNQDGTIKLNSGYSGSLDSKGWRMTHGNNGEPKFVRETNNNGNNLKTTSSIGDSYWDDRFFYDSLEGGTNGVVKAIYVDGENVYIAGAFTIAGYGGSAPITVSNVAVWKTNHWEALGTPDQLGPNGMVNAIAKDGNTLFLGGGFTACGSFLANNVVAFDLATTTWTALYAYGTTQGTNGTVYALVTIQGEFRTELYVGGSFTSAGGISGSNFLARWDNSLGWRRLETGNYFATQNSVFALAKINDDKICVGGEFNWVYNSDGLVSFTKGFAIWTISTHTFSAIPGGTNGVVNAINAVSNNEIYIGGNFTIVGITTTANNIAKYSEVSSFWTPLGGGVANGTNGIVRTIKKSGNGIYVGGDFTLAGQVTVNKIAYRNLSNSNWEALGATGCNDNVYALGASGSNMYIGGSFSSFTGITKNYIIRWDKARQYPNFAVSGRGLNKECSRVFVNGSDVYVSGYFTSGAPSTTLKSIGRWNGTSWSDIGLGSGINNYPYCFAIIGSDLYIGGNFSLINGITAHYIAKWNGTTWSALPLEVNGQVHVMAVSGTDLYVGGIFTNAGGIPANSIAKWNGTGWSALGSGLQHSAGWPPGVNGIGIIGNDVYVAGMFDIAGGISAHNIAKWNGNQWSTLGNGLTGMETFPDLPPWVYAMSISNNNIYVGGCFTTAGENAAKNIAKWNGSTWVPLGNGINFLVSSISANGSDLFVSGYYLELGPQPLVGWNGNNWYNVGSGIDANGVNTLHTDGTKLYVGGFFDHAGGKKSSNFGIWNIPRPALISPTNGQNMTTCNPAFSWSSITGNTLYHFQISTTLNFTQATIERDIDNLNGTSYTIATSLPAGTYYWRVAPSFSDQNGADGPWSNVRSFSVSCDPPPPPPDPGCPYVATWDGKQFIEDNNILPQSEFKDNLGRDVTDHYQILKPLKEQDNTYKIQIREFEHEKSDLDQFTLLAIDHSKNTKIALRHDNSIVEYRTPFELAKIQNSDFEDNKALFNIDNTTYPMSKNQEILLAYNLTDITTSDVPVAKSYGMVIAGKVSSARSIFTGGGGGKIDKVGEIQGNSNRANDSRSFTFRERTSLAYVPIDKFTGDVKLKFVHSVDLDYANVAVEVEPSYKLHTLELVSATHSNHSNVLNKLSNSDDIYSTLEPGEIIYLDYSVPEQQENTQRDFILISKGKYEHIKTESFGKPQNYSLDQNHPNPFNPTTSINYQLSEDGFVTLKVYNLVGQEVATLVNEMQSVGFKSVSFDASNLPSGIYYYRLQAGKFSDIKKMLLTK